MAVSTIYPTGTIQSSTTVMLSAKELVVQQMNVTAQNLSNSDTVGYKALMQVGVEAAVASPQKNALSQPISYVQSGLLLRDLSQGALKETGNPVDFSIIGQGYFALQVGDQKQYTRDGRFRLNEKGELVTHEGYPVLGQGGAINLGAYKKFIVQKNGTIVGINENDVPEDVTKFELVIFDNQQEAMEDVGAGRYKTDQEALPATQVQVMQGSVEMSNTNSMKESVSLMRLMKNYEHHQRVTETNDELMTQTINLRIN